MKMTGDEFRKRYVKNGKILPNNVIEIIGGLSLSRINITKIENLPNKINGPLNLSNNNITKIENLPEIIKGSICLSNNKIRKIENLPKTTNRYLELSNNNITKIENLSNIKSSTGTIYLNDNKIIEYKKTNSDFNEIWFNNRTYSKSAYLDFVKRQNVKETLKRL